MNNVKVLDNATILNNEISVIKDIMSLQVSLNKKENDLQQALDKEYDLIFPLKIVDIVNSCYRNMNDADPMFVSYVKETYAREIAERIKSSKKKNKKVKIRRTIFFVILALIFLAILLMMIILNKSKYIWILVLATIFFLLAIYGASYEIIEDTNKEVQKRKDEIHLWETYDYDKLYRTLEKRYKIKTELSIVRENKRKVKVLIDNAKKTIKIIPQKYVDYVSPVDQVPAIFDLIEIIEDRRADGIKELINTYVEDEFKKEAIKHMYTVEKNNGMSIICFPKN